MTISMEWPQKHSLSPSASEVSTSSSAAWAAMSGESSQQAAQPPSTSPEQWTQASASSMRPVYDDGQSTVYWGDSRGLMPRLDGLVVSDPPFNIGFRYGTGRTDRLRESDYMDLVRTTLRPPSVVVHRPEAMFLVAEALGVRPERCVAWVYNANTPRQWRMVSWFGVEPDFSLVKQPYKNPTDKRIKALMEGGSKGASLYDWWHISQVKNVSRVKTTFPCQMPPLVMDRIVGVTPAETVIDPFLGSGSTLLAAKRAGRRAIGIEVERRWVELAVGELEASDVRAR